MKKAALLPASRRAATKPPVRPDTRESLLAAACELMIEKDSIEFSLAEVGARSGMSAALVQYHFGSKEGLMLAIIERGVARAGSQLGALAAADMPARAKLRAHITGLVTTYLKMPYTNRLLHVLMQNDDEARARRVSTLYINPVADFYRVLIDQGVREGVFRPVEPMFLYFLVIGGCEHLAARRSVLRYVFDVNGVTPSLRREYEQFVYDTVLGGIGAR